MRRRSEIIRRQKNGKSSAALLAPMILADLVYIALGLLVGCSLPLFRINSVLFLNSDNITCKPCCRMNIFHILFQNPLFLQHESSF